MKLFRLSTLFSIAGAVGAGALLFWTSQNVQQAEDRLAGLRQAVQSERQSIRVLNAEWDYLNRPDRLETLAFEYLGLSSSAAAFSVSGEISDLPQVLIPAVPQRKPLMTPQPAVLEVPQASPAPRVPVPPAPPPQQQDGKSFQSLLEQLGEEGAAHE